MSQIELDICSIHIPCVKIKKSFLEKIIKVIFQGENLKGNYQIGIVFVNDYLMRKLNLKYRKIPKTTDVLAFPMTKKAPFKTLPPKSPPNLLGEIIISAHRIKKQAKSAKHSLKTELTLLVIHGVLHLLGYRDKTQADFKKMQKQQEKYLYKMLEGGKF